MGEGTKPALVVLAAGMGSRYGGLKQIDPVDEHGNIIMDFSIYDAKEAGFEKVVFIIKKTIEKEFKEKLTRAAVSKMELEGMASNIKGTEDAVRRDQLMALMMAGM